jgi:hypothetical protein
MWCLVVPSVMPSLRASSAFEMPIELISASHSWTCRAVMPARRIEVFIVPARKSGLFAQVAISGNHQSNRTQKARKAVPGVPSGFWNGARWARSASENGRLGYFGMQPTICRSTKFTRCPENGVLKEICGKRAPHHGPKGDANGKRELD